MAANRGERAGPANLIYFDACTATEIKRNILDKQ